MIMKTSIKNQNGMATLLMSLVMTMTISLISIYAAQVSVVEQKISSNHYRAKQAFEAAQAGMDASIFKLTSSIVNSLAAPGGGTPVGTENDIPFDNIQTTTYAVNGGNGHYKINFMQAGTRVNFDVYGFSDDNSSTNINDADQVIHQSVELTPTVGYQPPANLISLGKTTIGSNVSVTNTTETNKFAAVWSGGAVTYDPASIDVSAGGESGIYSKDSNLSALASPADPTNDKLKYLTQNNAFFENFFVESKIRFKNQSTIVDCETNGCTTNQLKSQLTFDANNNPLTKIIWVDAYDENTDTVRTLNFDKNFSLGTPDAPVILIVEGNVKFSRTDAAVNGIVYTTHNFSNGTGKGKITGSLISEGDISATGSMNLIYDNDATMTNVVNSEGTNRYTRVAGTWKDF